MTDLFLATSGMDAGPVVAAVPPACRRPVLGAPAVTREGDDHLIALAELTPRGGAVHLLPSFSAPGGGAATFRFEVCVRAAAGWSPWIGGAAVGPAPLPEIAGACEALRADIDVFTAPAAVAAARVRLRVRGDEPARLAGAPWMVAVSAWDGAPSGAGTVSGAGVSLPVPALSQMDEDATIAARICSPASVAMVLAYWGRPCPVADVAREAFHPALGLYGVWPAAIAAAARRGVAGYLLRFPDWASAAWCLERGLPIVASVRYAAGELSDAAVPATPGHLIVLTGYDGEHALVNDPAAPAAAAVARRYALDELRRVWLERAGVGYVFLPPAAE